MTVIVDTVEALATSLLGALVPLADGDWGHMNLDGGWWMVMVLGMILFWALVILGIVWLVREIGGHPRPRQARGAPDAIAVLERRLAEGEISVEDYEERRRSLQRSE